MCSAILYNTHHNTFQFYTKSNSTDGEFDSNIKFLSDLTKIIIMAENPQKLFETLKN
jgi:hypothetical protein